MAYALSAAMAVTVVPTYMMKPLTVMADEALTKTVKNANGGEENGADLSITVLDTAEANATIKFYVSESAALTGIVTDNESNLGDAIPGSITPGATDATVSIATLKAKATEEKTYTIYYAYSKDNTDVSSSTLVKAGTIEVTATSSTPTVTPAITADTVVSQGKTLGLSTAPAMYALYSSKDATAKPVYVLKKTNGSFDVPYDAPTGLFYIKDVSEKDEAYGSNENDYTIDIKAASPTTGISLSTTSSNVYYKGTAGSTVDSTNRETVAIKLSGADDANYKSLAISAKTGIANATPITEFREDVAESCGDFKITKSGDNLYVVMDKAPNTATLAGSDTLELTVSVSVVGRTNPFTKKITLKAVADTTAAIQGTDLALTANKSVIATNEVATVTAINKNIESKQNVYFALGSGANVEESTLVAKNGILTLKDANKKVLATYDIDNGEFKAVKAGEYQVIMFVDGTTAPDGKLTSTDTIKKALTINAAEFSIDTVAGKVSNTTSTFDVKTNDAVVTTFGGATLYASYTVEDPTIATVTGTSLEDAVVTFKKPGITKVTAEIKGYGNQEYNFTTTGYFVVAPRMMTMNSK